MLMFYISNRVQDGWYATELVQTVVTLYGVVVNSLHSNRVLLSVQLDW